MLKKKENISAFLLYICYNFSWKKVWWYLVIYYVDLKVENNEEKFLKKDIEATYQKNNLKFNYDEEVIKMTINDNDIIMEKENKDSSIIFDFKLGTKTSSKYFLKDLNFYIDTEVLTNKLEISNDRIYV